MNPARRSFFSSWLAAFFGWMTSSCWLFGKTRQDPYSWHTEPFPLPYHDLSQDARDYAINQGEQLGKIICSMLEMYAAATPDYWEATHIQITPWMEVTLEPFVQHTFGYSLSTAEHFLGLKLHRGLSFKLWNPDNPNDKFVGKEVLPECIGKSWNDKEASDAILALRGRPQDMVCEASPRLLTFYTHGVSLAIYAEGNIRVHCDNKTGKITLVEQLVKAGLPE